MRHANILGAVAFNASLLSAMSFWTAGSNSWMFTSALWVTFLVEHLAVSILAAIRAYKSSLITYIGGSLVCGAVTIGLYGAILPRHDANPIARGVILSTYLNTAGPLGAVVGATALFVTFRAIVHSQRLRKYPAVVVFAELQVLTKMLGSDNRSLSDASLQNEINARLERAAICLQKGVARAVFLSTPSIKGVFQLRLDRAAARLREYQLWVALPRVGTRDSLFSEIAQTCADFSAGLYDLLPESDVPVLGARDYASSVGKTLRGLVAGIFPLFVLWCVRQFDLMPQGALGSSLTIAAIIWVVVSVVGLIDPLYSGKIAALKEVMSIFTGGEK
ncbi:hypothetical protein ACFU93_04755 [Streptomyces sp. NPDC057611]|uniref:hypothetical protein n=1 Tax=Streptomyces sp. NPDC057611 TaxID=3346182 RepID=UPI0036D05B3B